MQRCAKCVLPDRYPKLTFDDGGVCNLCRNHKPFTPLPEERLLRQFEGARSRRKPYEALVPLSGGKDSTYVLWLATKVYGLRVLAFTYDNGFLTEIARGNIARALEASGADHVLSTPNWGLLRRLYRTHLLRSGELCTVCAQGIVSSYVRTALMYSIPLVLTGNTLMEEGSGTGEDGYDQVRFRAISRDGGELAEQEIERSLVFPKLGMVGRRLYLRARRTAKAVSPFYYRPRVSEAEVAAVVSREMGWEGHDEKDHGKHIDCMAEPLSNRIRSARLGYSRKDAQYSTLVRMGELDREAALDMLARSDGEGTAETEAAVLDRLGLSQRDLRQVMSVPRGAYSGARSLEARLLRAAVNTASRNKALFRVARSVWRRL